MAYGLIVIDVKIAKNAASFLALETFHNKYYNSFYYLQDRE